MSDIDISSSNPIWWYDAALKNMASCVKYNIGLPWLSVIICTFSIKSWESEHTVWHCQTEWNYGKIKVQGLQKHQYKSKKGYKEKTEPLRGNRENRWIKVALSILEKTWRAEKYTEKLRDRRWGWREWEIKGNSVHDVRPPFSAANWLQMAGREVRDGN